MSNEVISLDEAIANLERFVAPVSLAASTESTVAEAEAAPPAWLLAALLPSLTFLLGRLNVPAPISEVIVGLVKDLLTGVDVKTAIQNAVARLLAIFKALPE